MYSEGDGNLAALARHEQEVEREEQAYEELLDSLRDADPEEYKDIVESMGWGDADITVILGDL